jgi:hypothetical protein
MTLMQPARPGELELWLGPEAEEFTRRHVELTLLQRELARREQELAGKQGELAAFEAHYRAALGGRYARLDDLAERLEAARAGSNGGLDPVDDPVREQERRAHGTTHEGDNWSWTQTDGEGALGHRATVSESGKRLLRRLARLMHPDLARTQEEREQRTNLMVAANLLYERDDVEGLERMLADWERGPDSVVGNGLRADLERTRRRIFQLADRLRAIDKEFDALDESAMGWLRRRVERARSEGWDLLAHMVRELDRQIMEAIEELNRLSAEARLQLEDGGDLIRSPGLYG